MVVNGPYLPELLRACYGAADVLQRQLYGFHQIMPVCQMRSYGRGEGAACAVGGNAERARVRPPVATAVLLH